MPSDVETEKQQFRAGLRAQRRSRRESHLQGESSPETEALTDRLTTLVRSRAAHTVSAYLSTPSEPNTRPFLRWAADAQVTVILPISRADGLLDWTPASDAPDVRGLHGVPEASGPLLGVDAVKTVDLMLIPAAAVDASGIRLGWGRGYFDKTLSRLKSSTDAPTPPVFAVIFDDELVERVPREPHDQAVDGVVTPLRTLEFAGPAPTTAPS